MSDLRLTNSEMKQAQRCRRKWYLGTYRGLRRPDSKFNYPLSIGSRIHDVLEFFYEPGFNRDRESAMTEFWHGVARDLEEHSTMQKDIDKEADLCEAILEGYFDWIEEEGEDADYRVVGPEREMEAPLIEGSTILSKIDVMIERVSDGKRGNLEHKTVGDFRMAERAQIDTQFLTEHLVQFLDLMAREGDTAEENRAEFVVLNMLKKSKRTSRAKPPFYVREEVHHNVEELRNHWKHMAESARTIMSWRQRLDAGADHHDVCPPNPTRDCDWDCPFKSVCLSGMMDDGSDWEGYLDEHFVVGDPLERYVQGRE